MQLFLPTLTLILITLKLIGKTSLSWWWVWAPMWGAFAAFMLLTAMAVTTQFLANHRRYKY